MLIMVLLRSVRVLTLGSNLLLSVVSRSLSMKKLSASDVLRWKLTHDAVAKMIDYRVAHYVKGCSLIRG